MLQEIQILVMDMLIFIVSVCQLAGKNSCVAGWTDGHPSTYVIDYVWIGITVAGI